MLLFRLSGVFLLRLAARQFWALLFQEPPRFTRLEPKARTQMLPEHASEIPHLKNGG
jgi:hypothetical protein